jgi:pyruvate dehydrogenase E1 component
MLTEHEDVFYYLTIMNENYAQPAMPEGAEEGILRGMHVIREAEGGADVQLLGSGTILREVLAGADLLAEDFGVTSDVWSVTSFTELRKDGMEAERFNRLRAGGDGFEPRTAYVEQQLGGKGPVVAATDYIRALPDGIRPWVRQPYTVLGTDGFGRSDYRKALRAFFEVDRHHVVVAALRSLGRDEDAKKAIEQYGIDPESEAPWRI